MSGARSRLDGLIVLNKPAGWTSHDAVARARRLTGERRIGHAGTLDPLATGVLPLGIGQGTRLLEYLSHSGKAYRATVRLGVSTNTYDREGEITATRPLGSLTREGVEEALGRFRGRIEQRPPVYSALKRAGKPLYQYARAGIEIEIEPRLVQIDSLRLSAYAPPEIELEIECGSGFYVRSLAHDLGEELGCGAHLTALVRTRAGPFRLEGATTIEALEQAASADRLLDLLWALDAPLRQHPAVILDAVHSADVINGKTLQLPLRCACTPGETCRAYSAHGEFLAVLRVSEHNALRPVKVFPEGRRGPHFEMEFA